MSNWKSAPLTFYNNKITCDETGSIFFDAEVMMDWEDPIMSASSAYITEGGGDILEVGFGMGISSNYIQSHNISSHTIIENHPQVIEKAIEWSKDKSNVTFVYFNPADHVNEGAVNSEQGLVHMYCVLFTKFFKKIC